MDKIKVYLMFYPINWNRHDFDYMQTPEIINTIKERGTDDVKFVPWCEITEDQWEEVWYDADLFNDWDDFADDYVIEDCQKLIRGTELTEQYIKEHWCMVVTKDTMDKIMEENN